MIIIDNPICISFPCLLHDHTIPYDMGGLHSFIHPDDVPKLFHAATEHMYSPYYPGKEAAVVCKVRGAIKIDGLDWSAWWKKQQCEETINYPPHPTLLNCPSHT